MTSPTIYNLLRARKKERLAQAFEPQPQTGACYAGPILVGCPSCKIGIARCLIQLKEKHPVLHVLEWLVRTAASASAAAPTRPAATCASSSARRE